VRPPLGGQAARLRLAFGCEMGSDFGVKSHNFHIYTPACFLQNVSAAFLAQFWTKDFEGLLLGLNCCPHT
jgi:hypothetical protein